MCLQIVYLIYMCNILTLNPAVNQITGASGRSYRGITLTYGRVESEQIGRSQEAGGRQTII